MTWAFAAYVYLWLVPVLTLLRLTGRTASKLGWGMRRRERRLAALDPLRGYVPGPQDVFVATYPKSGTNWMLQVVHQLIHHGEGEFEHVHDVVPWPEAERTPWFLRGHAVALAQVDHWRRAPEPLRAIKTHLPWPLLPYDPRARYVVVVRDPKDVVVSSWHFVRDAVLGPAMPPVDAWYRMFLEGSSLGGSWGVHVAGYWAQRHRPNVLIVPFKAMKRDLRGVVTRLAAFLGIRASDAVLDRVCERASFAHMKAIDHKFHLGRLIPWRAPGAMLRRGAEAAGADLLTLEQRRALDRRLVAEMRIRGSDFPYDEFADRA